MNGRQLTWEQTVQWLRQQPGQEPLVRACYYDDPLIEAAKRFADSDEWKATRSFLPERCGQALDLGAGRGIASYTLGREGWQVIALEPDSSPIVGAKAIRELAEESGLPIRVVEEYGEILPFDRDTFDLVYGRQVLHHARDLPQVCREIARVLKPGGRFIAAREHVISRQADLILFLDQHPLHRLYGGENAHLLREYLSAIEGSDLRILNIIGPLESPINYSPMTRNEWLITCGRPLSWIVGRKMSQWILSADTVLSRYLLRLLSTLRSRMSNTPGRLYSFISEK